MKLKNKIAVITGGSGVLGSHMAMALAKEGCKVVILGATKEKVDHVVSTIKHENGQAYGYTCDILDKEALIKIRKTIHEEIGTIDILINAAGGNHPQATTDDEFFEIDNEETKNFFDLEYNGIQHVFGVNFMGTFLATQVFGTDLVNKKSGTIINISSMNAFKPLTKIPAYSAAKAAVSNFTQWCEVHFAKTGVRVNAIAPGFFLTQQNHNLLIDKDGNYTKRAEKIISHTPQGRFGKPEELISALLWLVDDKSSSFVNGIVLPIDGGFSAYSGV